MNIGFTGCSFTLGKGLLRGQIPYPDHVATLFDSNVYNYSNPGANNHNIFTQSLYHILEKKHDMFFIQWTSAGRQQFCYNYLLKPNLVFGRWDNQRPSIISEEKYKIFFDCYKILDNELNQFTMIHTYVNILKQVANLIGTKIFYINGHLTIDNVFFKDISSVKDLFNLSREARNAIGVFDLESEVDIVNNFHHIKQSLEFIKENNDWINPTQSLISEIIDRASDGRHPGPLSHKKYADMIYNSPLVKEFVNKKYE